MLIKCFSPWHILNLILNHVKADLVVVSITAEHFQIKYL